MSRLDIERQKRLEPKRVQRAIDELNKRGIKAQLVTDNTVQFFFKGKRVTYFPYSGWHTGKSINDGRGFNHLFDQLDGKS